MRSRSVIGAVAFSACSWFRTRVRSATAERRAISSARMAVRIPRRLGRRDALVGEYALGCGDRVDPVGLPGPPIAPARTLDLQHRVLHLQQVLAQASAPAAGALDPEHQLTTGGELLSPALQLLVAASARRERELGEHLSEVVERDGVVPLLVGIDPDCYHRILLIIDALW